MLVVTGQVRAAAVSANWLGGSGNWSDPAKWSSAPLFPDNGNGGCTFDVTLGTTGGAYTVTTSGTVTVQKFTMQGYALGGGTIIANDMMTLTGGTLGSDSVLYANGGLTLRNDYGLVLVGTLVNGGHAIFDGLVAGKPNIACGDINNQPVIENLPGASFDFQKDGGLAHTWSIGTFYNEGTILKSGGTGTSTLDLYVRGSGSILVQRGTLALTAGALVTGPISIDGGATLKVSPGDHEFMCDPGATVTGAGGLDASGGSFWDVVHLGGPSRIQQGSLFNAATQFDSQVDLNDAVFNALTVFNGPVGISGSYFLGSYHGGVHGSGDMTFAGTVSLHNCAGLWGTGLATVLPGGCLQLGGTPSNAYYLGWRLDLYGRAALSDGSVLIGDSSILNIMDGAVFEATADGGFGGPVGTSTAHGYINNRGTFLKSGGIGQTAIDGHWAFDNQGMVTVSSGTVSIGNAVQLMGNTLTGGTWYVSGSGKLTLSGSGGSDIVTNQAEITLDGAAAVFSNLTYLEENQGGLSLLGGQRFVTSGGLTNAGTLRIGADSFLYVTAPYMQTGGLAAVQGELHAAGMLLLGGRVEGTGKLYSILTMAGATLAPGGTNAGVLTATQAHWVRGTVEIDVTGQGGQAGTDYDRLALWGLAEGLDTVDLKVTIGPGLNLSGQVLTILTTASDLRGGHFASVAFGGGYGDVTFGDGFVTISRFSVLGDANRDGIVDQADYTSWYNNYGAAGATWAQGDFTGDKLVDQADYTIWYNNYGAGGGSAPEPATLLLLAMGALVVPRRREHGRSRGNLSGKSPIAM